ncbi:MAG: hypothetical protein LRY50_03620 [Geovibrio sp.]|nr:hypothetical protein [Geovibrio sp.]
MVLQGYNGNLTMLDGKSGGGDSDYSGGGSNAPRAAAAASPAFGQMPASAPDLDDEIPF